MENEKQKVHDAEAVTVLDGTLQTFEEKNSERTYPAEIEIEPKITSFKSFTKQAGTSEKDALLKYRKKRKKKNKLAKQSRKNNRKK